MQHASNAKFCSDMQYIYHMCIKFEVHRMYECNHICILYYCHILEHIHVHVQVYVRYIYITNTRVKSTYTGLRTND